MGFFVIILTNCLDGISEAVMGASFVSLTTESRVYVLSSFMVLFTVRLSFSHS